MCDATQQRSRPACPVLTDERVPAPRAHACLAPRSSMKTGSASLRGACAAPPAPPLSLADSLPAPRTTLRLRAHMPAPPAGCSPALLVLALLSCAAHCCCAGACLERVLPRTEPAERAHAPPCDRRCDRWLLQCFGSCASNRCVKCVTHCWASARLRMSASFSPTAPNCRRSPPAAGRHNRNHVHVAHVHRRPRRRRPPPAPPK
jgi:hypothetical protein